MGGDGVVRSSVSSMCHLGRNMSVKRDMKEVSQSVVAMLDIFFLKIHDCGHGFDCKSVKMAKLQCKTVML